MYKERGGMLLQLQGNGEAQFTMTFGNQDIKAEDSGERGCAVRGDLMVIEVVRSMVICTAT